MSAIDPDTPVARPEPRARGVRWVFGDRQIGNGSSTRGHQPAKGIAAAASQLGVDARNVARMEQVHGSRVAVVDHAGDVASETDGLVTTVPAVALAVLTADCVPLLLSAGTGIAVAHAGRAGVEQNIAGAVVARLLDASVSGAEAVHAHIGPAIGPCCYEVPADMAADFERLVPGSSSTTTWGTPSIDLPGAVTSQLRNAGVSQIGGTPGCTRCVKNRWFSHRATMAGDAPEGRNVSMIIRRTHGA